MTEKENNISSNGQTDSQEALTSKPNASKLGGEGDIFMSEEGPPGEHDRPTEHSSKSSSAATEVSISEESVKNVLEGLGLGEIAQENQRKRHQRNIAKGTAEKFFPDGGKETEEFTNDLTNAIDKSEKENRDNSSEKIYQEMIQELIKAESQEDFTKFLAIDVAWASMIANIESGIKNGSLNVNKFEEDESKKDEFLKDLEIARGLITKARKGELNFEREEDFRSARNLFLRLSGLETEHETREEKGIRDVTLGDFIKRFEGQFGYDTLLNSAEDLARLIMSAQDPEWRTGGKHELLDKEGKFKAENFLAWIRSRILYYHDLHSDAEVNLFSDIGVTTNYRSINFGEMMAYAKYFMTKVEKPDPKMGMLPTGDYHLPKKQENLKELLLIEVWLFQMSHNFNVKYHMVEGIEKDLPNALAEIHYNNIFTKNRNRLLKILMLSGNNAEELEWIIGKDKIEHQEKQGSVGKDIQKILLAYYHLSEIAYKPDGEEKNMFEEVLGEEGTLNFYRYIIGKTGGVEELEKISGETEMTKEIRDAAEKCLKNWELELNDLNIFNHPKKPEAIKELVNGAMVAAISDERIVFEILKKDYPKEYKELCLRFSIKELEDKEIMHAKEEAKYAVEWVSTMVRWMGIQARNDTKAIGFDGWSKLINTAEYRKGQYKDAKSAVGNIQNVFGLKRIGLNFLEATTVSEGDAYGEKSFKKTLLEILQGGQGNNVSIDEDIRAFSFKGNAQRKFIDDHVFNAFKFYEFITTHHGIDYSKMVVKGAYGRLQIIEEERDKVFKEFWKNTRYTFDLPEFLYGHEVREWWYEKDESGLDENGEEKDPILKFGEKKLEEHMFNEEVLSFNLYADKDGKPEADGTNRGLFKNGYRDPFDREFEGEGEAPEHVRKRLARLPFAYFIAKDLWSHRQEDEGYSWYSSMDIAAIEFLFKNFPYGIEEEDLDKDGKYKTTKKKSSFFTAKEFDQIEGMAQSRYKDLFREEFKKEGIAAFAHAGFVGTLKFLQAVMKGY
ncbi:MAG: hypothetical protein V1697_00490 [Candidatus Levyibacteriota bacterium]